VKFQPTRVEFEKALASASVEFACWDQRGGVSVLECGEKSLLRLLVLAAEPLERAVGICRAVRLAASYARILAIATGDAELVRNRLLDAGADHVVTAAPLERVLAYGRTMLDEATGVLDTVVRHDPFLINLSTGEVFVDGQLVALEPAERRVLWCLVRHADALVSWQELAVTALTRFPDEAARKTVHQLVCTLRQKLRQRATLVKSRRTIGYCVSVLPLVKIDFLGPIE
jgi:DNA-binding response OmpR family regulator